MYVRKMAKLYDLPLSLNKAPAFTKPFDYYVPDLPRGADFLRDAGTLKTHSLCRQSQQSFAIPSTAVSWVYTFLPASIAGKQSQI